MRSWPILLLAGACAPTPSTDSPGDTDVGGVDLVAPVPPGEVRAGVITDPASLFAGVFAEGRPGDVMLKNDRARWIVQGVRPGSFLVAEGGGILDADVVRPDGELGHDVVKDWAPMPGLGRVIRPTSVEVVDDGEASGRAVVVVEGTAAGISFLEGNVETPGFFGGDDLDVRQEYVLEPDSPFLEVRTTVTPRTSPTDLAVGDLLMGAPETAWRFADGAGLDQAAPEFRWSAYVGHGNEVAVAILAPPGQTLAGNGLDLLAAAADLVGGFAPIVTLQPGESTTATRYYGVARDLATLTDAWLAEAGVPTTTRSDVVTAADGPVAGATVAVTVDGKPFTLAVTGADGAFSVDVPTEGEVELRAIGRGTGRFPDHPPGFASVGPYAHPSVAEATLAALADAVATPIPRAEGRGVASDDAPFTLGVPATLRLVADDGLPFAARVGFTSPDAPVDRDVVPERAGGAAAAGWSRDGDLDLLVEPGTYDLVVHRGVRWELFRQQVTLVAGQTLDVEIDLGTPIGHAGWLLGDPHAHAVSSADAAISVEDRVAVHAGNGLQVHFGTDHDRLTDYRPVLAAMGLEGTMTTIVAEEFSPTLRGHFNVYPIDPKPEEPNLGAWAWWDDLRPTTDEMLVFLGERHPGAILQSNHPTDSGIASNARWAKGQVRQGSRWSTGFQAIEVLNAGDYSDFLPFWWDLASRGFLTAPVGVSDSHGHFAGGTGVNVTWIGAGVDDPRDLDDDALIGAFQARRTIASRGPFLDVSPAPGSLLAGDEPTITARVVAPSWIVVDRLQLVCDGEVVTTVDGTEATFTPSFEVDRLCAVVASGSQPMQPVTGETPWAIASPIQLDVDSDGWEPFLPPLVVD